MLFICVYVVQGDSVQNSPKKAKKASKTARTTAKPRKTNNNQIDNKTYILTQSYKVKLHTQGHFMMLFLIL